MACVFAGLLAGPQVWAAPPLQVSVVDELGRPVSGFVASAEVKDRRLGQNATRSLALGDGPRAHPRFKNDGKADGKVLFQKGPWEKFAADGGKVTVYANAPGFWGVSQRVTLQNKGQTPVRLVLRYPLLVQAKDASLKGFSLALAGKPLAADGGPGDTDGKADGVLYARIDEFHVAQGASVSLVANGPDGGKIAQATLVRAEQGWLFTLSPNGGKLSQRDLKIPNSDS